MTNKIELFESFQALTNPSLFNLVCDALEGFKVRNHLSNAIQINLNEANQEFTENEYVSANKVLKLVCELGGTTLLMKNILMFAVWYGLFQHEDDSTFDIFDNDEHWEERVLTVKQEEQKAVFKWMKEFMRFLDPKQIPELIVELEKQGFERS